MDLIQAANSPQYNQPYQFPENYRILALDKTKSTPTLLTFERQKDINPRLHKQITTDEWAAICKRQGAMDADVLGNDLLSTDIIPPKEHETEARFLQLKAQGYKNLSGKERSEYSRLKEIYEPKLADSATESE